MNNLIKTKTIENIKNKKNIKRNGYLTLEALDKLLAQDLSSTTTQDSQKHKDFKSLIKYLKI